MIRAIVGAFAADLRHATRLFTTHRLTTLAALATLAIGIGANAALFSLVNAVLLRPLPYADPHRLVMVWQTVERLDLTHVLVSLPEYVDYRASATGSFDGMAVYQLQRFTRRAPDYPEHVQGARVSADLLPLLGVPVAYGRAFGAYDSEPGAVPVALVTEGFWRRAVRASAPTDTARPDAAPPQAVPSNAASSNNAPSDAARPDAAAPDDIGWTPGRMLALNDANYTIVGILPPAFALPGHRGVEILVPVRHDAEAMSRRNTRTLSLLARLRPGVTRDRAEQELRALAGRLSTTVDGLGVRLVPLDDEIVGTVRRPLVLLMLAVGAVLLIGCANVAHLSLARAAAREREMAVRAALGASRWRLIGQVLTESLLVAAAGGAIGLLTAALTLDLLVRLSPANLPRVEQTSIDLRVLLFSAAVTIAAGTLFGLGSALQASRPAISDALKQEPGTIRPGRGWLRGFLVGSEVALAFTLLVCAGLLLRGFVKLLAEAPGFDPSGMVTTLIDLPAERYSEPARREAFFRHLLDRIRAAPGVEHAGLTSVLPLSGENSDFGFTIPERPAGGERDFHSADWRIVSDGYLEAMRIPLRRGRAIGAEDRGDAPKVVMINETMARTFWPGANPLGQSIKLGLRTSTLPVFTIVGVVGDVRHRGLHLPARPEMYMAVGQVSEVPSLFRFPPMTLVVRTTSASADFGALSAAVRRIVTEIEPAQAVGRMATLQELMAGSVATRRFAMRLLGGFAAIALFLAVIGTYGVVSHTVGQRTREVGVRMALGAERRDVVRAFLAQAARPVAIGLAAGAAVALVAARAMSSMLYEVSPADPLTFGVTLLTMAVVSTAASWVPAWRAATADPVLALRSGAEALPGTFGRRARASVARMTDRIQQRLRRERDADAPGVLIELAAAARAARTLDDLFDLVAEAVRRHLDVDAVAIFTRDERTGDYVAKTCQPPTGDLAPRGLRLAADAFSVRRLRRLSLPLGLEPDELDTWLRALESAAPGMAETRGREVRTLRLVRAAHLVQIRLHDEMIGILAVGSREGDPALPVRTRDLLIGLAAQIAFIIQNARLVGRLAEQERLARELTLAAEVQRRLLPECAPAIATLDLAAFCRPARSVGGDYYDFLRLDEESIGLVVADVAGKGLSAALVMGVVQASWRSLSPLAGDDLPGLVTRLDALLHGSTREASYATMFCARYDERTRSLRFVNAGHNTPFLWRASAAPPAPIALSTGGPVIGLLPPGLTTWEQEAIPIGPGDLVVCYTDGITEALDVDGEEFGEPRLLAAIEAASAGDASAIADAIWQSVSGWIGEAAQYDDLTVMVIKGR
jgi:predicted permease